MVYAGLSRDGEASWSAWAQMVEHALPGDPDPLRRSFIPDVRVRAKHSINYSGEN
jgi:hypothetical protein